MSPESIERASTFFGVAAVWLTTFAAVAGCFGWYFSSKAASAKDEAFKRFRNESQVAIASADERAANANKRAASLESEAASARLELEKLKEKNIFRQITPAQEAEFAVLVKDAPKGAIQLITEHRMPEIAMYAAQVKDMLAKAGFNPGGINIVNATKGDAVGITVVIQDLKNPLPQGVAIRNGFELVGIPVQLTEDAKFPAELCRIIIGRKESDVLSLPDPSSTR